MYEPKKPCSLLFEMIKSKYSQTSKTSGLFEQQMTFSPQQYNLRTLSKH